MFGVPCTMQRHWRCCCCAYGTCSVASLASGSRSVWLLHRCRAISDGIFAALVCDVMVHPDFQVSNVPVDVQHQLLCICVQHLGTIWPKSSRRCWQAVTRMTSLNREPSTHGMVQRQGLGTKMMVALLKHVRRRGPSSFGAFPRPKQVRCKVDRIQLAFDVLPAASIHSSLHVMLQARRC